MLGLLTQLRPNWPILTLAASAALLAGAHAFEYWGGLAPCPLCLDQRNWHWGVVGLSIIGIIALRFKPQWTRLVIAMIGLVLLGSAGQAAYHVAVEQGWAVAQCDARINLDDIRPLDFTAQYEIPKCDEIAWSMFGISMAGYNALISLVLAILSLALVVAPERKA